MNSLNELKKDFRMIADYHTHTTYSKVGPYLHGKGTIMENVAVADMLGLKELAITDHGPSDIYGLRMKNIESVKTDIEKARTNFPQLKILLGIEADLKDTETGLDVTEEDIKHFDIINAGYHISVPGCNAPRSIISTKIGASTRSLEKLRGYNTELALRALYKNNIKVLTHPGDKGPFDMDKLCKACEETGTLMEISSRHHHMTIEELELSKKYDVKYVISSDAHKSSQVGLFEVGLLRALKAGIPVEKIVNIEKR